MKKRVIRGLVTTMSLIGMSLTAGSASADPACEIGDPSANIESGSTYCEVTAFGDSYAYRISLRSPQIGGGYADLQVTRVGLVPGSPHTYDCDFDNASVKVTSSTETNGEFENREDELTLACGQPVTLIAGAGSTFNGASCQVIFGCQGE
ncbi:MAG TPA: hypothetical protein VMF89_35975 [Polyangiales bacterium]|nr:hypothetical protein [Polyangiales bacterium]